MYTLTVIRLNNETMQLQNTEFHGVVTTCKLIQELGTMASTSAKRAIKKLDEGSSCVLHSESISINERKLRIAYICNMGSISSTCNFSKATECTSDIDISVRSKSRSVFGILEDLYSILYCNDKQDKANEVFNLLKKIKNDEEAYTDITETKAFKYCLEDMVNMSKEGRLTPYQEESKYREVEPGQFIPKEKYK